MRAFAFVTVLALIASFALAGSTDGADWTPGRNDRFVSMSDGVEIDTTTWVPAGTPPGARLPAVIVIHGYGGSKDVSSAREAAERGFVGFAYSTRGFGQSGGEMDIVGPRSIADLKELVRWLPENGPVDPARIAVVGASYGGAHAMQIATDPDAGVATVVAIATFSDLEYGLVPNGVMKLSYPFGFYLSGNGLVQDGNEGVDAEVAGVDLGRRCLCDTYAPEVHRWLAEGALGVGTDDIAAGFAERSAIHRAANVRIPVLLVQGMNDDLFSAEQAIEFFERIPHAQKKMYLGFVGHPRAVANGPEVDYALDLSYRWLDHTLRGVGPSPLLDGPIEVASTPWTGATRSLERWTRGEEGAAFALTAARALDPVAGRPAAHAIANTLAAGAPDDPVAHLVVEPLADAPAGTPVDTRAYRSGPLAEATTILGTPRAELVLTPLASEHMVAVKIFDRAPDGSATLVSRGVHGFRDSLPGATIRVDFDLEPYHYTFEAGHEIEVRIASSDTPLHIPVKSPFATIVHVGEGGSAVRLPIVREG